MSLTYNSVVAFARSIYDRGITTPSVLDAETYFPNAQAFTGRWRDIRNEALAAKLADVPRFHEIMEAQRDISANDGHDWRIMILKAYGRAMPRNLTRCPVTASILRETPEVLSCSFSFLAPGKHIPVHRGPFRGILRFHLMLSMPNDDSGRPACVMEINGEPYRLAEGQSLLWDDTFPHEVWNRGDRIRVAMLLDVWRPGMPWHLALASWLVIAILQAVMRLRGLSYGG